MNDDFPVLMADGPVLVFGGPYSNLQATEALLAEARRRGIPPERTICTGDVVAYCADAAATVALVRGAGIPVVMGNCEESLGGNAEDCGCGFTEGSACDRLAAAWYAHADRMLDADARAWMRGLPRRIDLHVGGARLAVVHGSPSSINAFVFASSPGVAKLGEIAGTGCDGVIGGHCGLPFTQTVEGRLWHNAGAIGMPADDATPRVWFSVLTPTGEGLRIEHCALDYDQAGAAAAMSAAGLSAEYATALRDGWWPSCDVLRLPEIRARGVPLLEAAVVWDPAAARLPVPRGRRREPAVVELWPEAGRSNVPPLNPLKFRDPVLTAAGETRASVPLSGLKTLWFNTGTLCNIACRNCYIESSPRNDRLAYLGLADLRPYLDEIERDGWPTEEIAFTGGEPFMNPELLPMLEECLTRGFRTLVLTNAMRPMQRLKKPLLALNERLGEHLIIRVSLDHFAAPRHEEERGPDTYQPTLDGLVWLARNGFNVAVAGRTMWGEDAAVERAGYARLFAEHEIPVDADDPVGLVLFPEMDLSADVPEITTACWGILGKSPDDVMCASSRMVVKRKGETRAAVLACTLLPYDAAFELGPTLADAAGAVPLNHPHCAKFCVLGGASCSRG